MMRKLVLSMVISIAVAALPLPAFANDSFNDVPEDHTFHDAIEYIADEGIANGYKNGAYGPDDPVTRGQMAAFMVRAFAIRHSLENYFTDTSDSIFKDAVNAIAAAGIANGYGNGEYGPDDLVTRAQMAAFLVRVVGLDAAASPDYFWDDDGSKLEGAINTLTHYGLTNGCKPALFCPNESVTRGEMAAFLKRALALGDNPSPNPRIDEKSSLPPGGTLETNKLLAQILAAQRGWTGEQFVALDKLVESESKWKHTAQNPRSTAYGIFQFLNSTWGLTDYSKSSNPEIQIRAGLQYIERMYDTPARAWAFKYATIKRNSSYAPSDLRGKAREWISKGYTGY